jgi:hypothetical protein
MMKRMQVLVQDAEYRRFQTIARRRGMTLAEWVRQTLRGAFREEPGGGREKKLAAIRAATRHAFPTGDIDQILGEIARGYDQPDVDG